MDRQGPQVGERAHAAAEVVEGEPAAEAAERLHEGPGVQQVADHRGLGELETDGGRRSPMPVEALGDEVGEALLADGGPGQVDEHPAAVTGAARTGSRGEQVKRVVDHPAVDGRHQVEALGGTDELAGSHEAAVLVDEPQQHLAQRLAIPTPLQRQQALEEEPEPALLAGRDEPGHPARLVAPPRDVLVVGAVQVDPPAATLLGGRAGGVGRLEDLVDRRIPLADGRHPDAGGRLEGAAEPAEAGLEKALEQLSGPLPGELGGAGIEQHCELVPAEATDGVGVTDRALEDLGHLAQHVVAGGVATGVVDRPEAVDVEEADRGRRTTCPYRLDGPSEPDLELASVDQSGEGVVPAVEGELVLRQAPGSPHLRLAQLALDRRPEPGEIALDDVVVGPGAHRLDRHLLADRPRDDQKRQVEPACPQHLERPRGAEERHVVVGDDHVPGRALERPPHGLGGLDPGHGGLEALARQVPGDQLGVVGRVLDDQHAQGGGHRGTSHPCGAGPVGRWLTTSQ